ncbi:MAG: hypothetical protein AAFO04_01320 [Cyanobacteria bacterium J06592_8]
MRCVTDAPYAPSVLKDVSTGLGIITTCLTIIASAEIDDVIDFSA